MVWVSSLCTYSCIHIFNHCHSNSSVTGDFFLSTVMITSEYEYYVTYSIPKKELHLTSQSTLTSVLFLCSHLQKNAYAHTHTFSSTPSKLPPKQLCSYYSSENSLVTAFNCSQVAKSLFSPQSLINSFAFITFDYYIHLVSLLSIEDVILFFLDLFQRIFLFSLLFWLFLTFPTSE